jgi:cyclopropane-fatty-acyl-phospholipid synthase
MRAGRPAVLDPAPAALDHFLRRLVRAGRLTIVWPQGRSSDYGDPAARPATVAIADATTVRRIALRPDLAFGEAYMDGALTPIGCTIYDVLEVLTRNLALMPPSALGRWRRRLRRAVRNLPWNRERRARRNVAHHYDIDNRIYAMFLDQDLQYSCAYFPTGEETLDQAQAAKKRLVAAKLMLDRPGLSVLDIGCGWGGLALTLAADHFCHVTGITLSREQLATCRARAAAAGLDDRVQFELLDYRQVARTFDRVVSVGMFEHVGVAHYPEFFAAVRAALRPDGVALLHTIGNSEGPAATNAWMEKYIFPGGYAPALSEVMVPLERSGLIATDIEVLRLHYAQTLRHWAARFAAHAAEVEKLHDARFRRMFEFYFAGAELAFRHGGEVVFQIQLARDQYALPMTRDYMIGVR